MPESGINTLRIFLYNTDLFICPDTNAIPITENVARLDGVIRLAAEHNLRLIVVLNNDPDLLYHPLYSNPDSVQMQTRFIIERYHNEATILAWDIRDRGDVDYRDDNFTREQVLTWVAETAIFIREIDPNHLVTAGWWNNALDTAPLVDFVSFQFYGEYADFRQEIANLRASAGKPILLSAIGYSTFALDEIAQRNLLFQAFEEVAQNDLLGWIVYMAFDYPRTLTCIEPDCPGSGQAIDHYGIWNTSYFRKFAVDAVEIMTGVQE
ncbi:MAG: cellulase family glycosylhydrolase [Anaerolineae bacterium]|nr:cellulase family glycosylhydrolase [Anaerolineae bacterium]